MYLTIYCVHQSNYLTYFVCVFFILVGFFLGTSCYHGHCWHLQNCSHQCQARPHQGGHGQQSKQPITAQVYGDLILVGALCGASRGCGSMSFYVNLKQSVGRINFSRQY